MGWVALLWGWIAAALMGVAKTGLPGFSIPSVALMTEAFADDARLAIGAMLPVLLVGDTLAVIWYRHHARWDRLWRLFPYVALGMVPGWLLLRWLPEGNDLRPILGVLILGLVALEVCRRRFDWQDVPHQWWFVAAMGLLAGFCTIVAHAAFPVTAVYLLSQGMAKREFMGTATWFYLIVNFTKVPFYAQAGMLTRQTLLFDLAIIPAALAGAILGIYVLVRIPQRLFDALALALSAVAAVRLLAA